MKPKFSHAFEVVRDLPEALRPLMKLAMNFHWSWHSPTRDLFQSIDKDLWAESNSNPVAFLQGLDAGKLQRLQTDSAFLGRMNGCAQALDDYLTGANWFDAEFPGMRDSMMVAYFCAEFGLTEGLPIYSGGLGVLAGDHLKAASDLGVPLVAVGLLYNRGYFRQRLDASGWQQEVYPQYDFYEMPLALIRGEDDQPIRIEVEFPDRVVTCQVWRADVGRVKLYLLDSNVLENAPADQTITDTLYGGDEEMRIRQEMILGIGGMLALKKMGINPTVCHMNEGHAAFLSIERIRQFMESNGCDFRTARQVIVNGNVFTTHTPVPAGFDLFTPELLQKYMGKAVLATGLGFNDFLRLGRMDPDDTTQNFNMAVLAMENANHVNGVAKLHAAVTREMFSSRWPSYPVDEVPVDAVTNGIHTNTWIGRRMSRLLDEHLGDGWRKASHDPENWKGVYNIPDNELWMAIEDSRGELVRFIRRRLQADLERRNMARPEFGMINGIFDPRVLTIGFARRFATYKRGSLMLTDRGRLLSLLNHSERPIQIVIAGKAHPRDDGGKKIIQDLVSFINNEGGRSRMVFLEDYDMEVARRLVQGVDLWLNNPRRPMEASGTSGMKVVPNGGLNVSVLDGWWDEGYSPEVGWAIGDRDQNPDNGHQDWLDSQALYNLLEREIAPKFYHRVDNGLPTQWLQMVKHSMARLAPQFSTARMVGDYTRNHYVPASAAFGRMSGDLSMARGAMEWRKRIRDQWAGVVVLHVWDDAKRINSLGKEITVKAEVRLGALTHGEVRVEAAVGRIGPNREITSPVYVQLNHEKTEGEVSTFGGIVVCDRGGYQGYTVRVVPSHPDVVIPSELNEATWEPA
ncbi:MAG: alpha-glucan family phosphorylase [Armatimonadetes bacterium]|nr:alpha-glucan family phosphorylase [Armatimonadota bacterium]